LLEYSPNVLDRVEIRRHRGPFHDRNIVILKDTVGFCRSVAWRTILLKDIMLWRAHSNGFFIVRAANNVINEGERSVSKDVDILICSDPAIKMINGPS